MQIVKPTAKVWDNLDNIDHIAQCARVCYASNKNTNNASFVEALWRNRHRSMFRHAGVYYIIPEAIRISNRAYIGASVVLVKNKYYVSVNEQSAREYWDEQYSRYKISQEEAEQNEIFYKYKLMRFTLCCETSIAITREYNRKSPNNIAEQSTRYVDFNKKAGIRFLKCHWMSNCGWYRKLIYKFMLKCSELFYKFARSPFGLNLPQEDARFILPLNTMSKVIYTYTIAEWEWILNMREFDWTGRAHPDAKALAQIIHAELEEYGYDINKYNDEV